MHHQTEANDTTEIERAEWEVLRSEEEKRLATWQEEADKLAEPKKQPKDYAEKDWIKYKLTEDEVDWQYENKESYAKIAKYWFFIAAGLACGYMFMLGVIS